MSKDLTADQLREAKNLDKTLKGLTKIKDAMKQYKLGDIYILEEWDIIDPNNIQVQKTHMNFPVKYKVCYISDEGIPYLRKLTSAGNVTGEVFVPPEVESVSILKRFANHNSFLGDSLRQRFVLDPEQLDSILLQQEFDPMAQHRDKSKLFNEINKHNKNVAICTTWTNGYKNISDFFKAKQPGDKFWTAPNKQYVVQSVAKVGREYVVTCTDMNQATVTFNFNDFMHRRLYKEQPRSFRKESQV